MRAKPSHYNPDAFLNPRASCLSSWHARCNDALERLPAHRSTLLAKGRRSAMSRRRVGYIGETNPACKRHTPNTAKKQLYVTSPMKTSALICHVPSDDLCMSSAAICVTCSAKTAACPAAPRQPASSSASVPSRAPSRRLMLAAATAEKKSRCPLRDSVAVSAPAAEQALHKHASWLKRCWWNRPAAPEGPAPRSPAPSVARVAARALMQSAQC